LLVASEGPVDYFKKAQHNARSQADMLNTPPSLLDLEQLSPGSFQIASLDDEIRVDRLCVALIKTFASEMAASPDTEPVAIGRCCRGADYFLREFIVADRRENLLQLDSGQIRRFAGHWYIVRNMDPNMPELEEILNGVAVFYSFLADHGLIDRKQAKEICAACRERDLYARRIEDFWAIEGDGFLRWREEIPL